MMREGPGRVADIAVDESIFDDANAVDITMFPLVVDGELNMAVGGTTYPFKDILTKEGFTFKNIVNGQALKLWLRVEPEAKPMEVTSTDRGIDCNRNYSGKTVTRSKDGLPLGLDPSTVARISPGAG